MAKKLDLQTIGALLHDVQEQFEGLKQVADSTDPVDLELFEATVSFLATNVRVYRKNHLTEADEDSSFDVEAEAVPPAPKQETIEEIAPTLPAHEKQEVVEEYFQVEPDVESEAELELDLEVEPESVVEPASRPLSLNEILANQRHPNRTETRVSSRLKTEKSTDLKSTINLNDKLLFIRDLFNGYSLAYSEAVELLNRYDTFAEADAFLQSNYAIKHDWTNKPETVEKFYSMLRKRFEA